MESISYKESDIDERIIRAVEEMGFETMTPIQQQAIPCFLEGKTVIRIKQMLENESFCYF